MLWKVHSGSEPRWQLETRRCCKVVLYSSACASLLAAVQPMLKFCDRSRNDSWQAEQGRINPANAAPDPSGILFPAIEKLVRGVAADRYLQRRGTPFRPISLCDKSSVRSPTYRQLVKRYPPQVGRSSELQGCRLHVTGYGDSGHTSADSKHGRQMLHRIIIQPVPAQVKSSKALTQCVCHRIRPRLAAFNG